ncbi:unnamed protein product, partial [Ilex paraguariensis]
ASLDWVAKASHFLPSGKDKPLLSSGNGQVNMSNELKKSPCLCLVYLFIDWHEGATFAFGSRTLRVVRSSTFVKWRE